LNRKSAMPIKAATNALIILTAAVFLASAGFLRAAVSAPDRQQLVQINAEIVEVDMDKTEQYGIKWINTIHTGETSIPAIFALGDMARLDSVFADLKALSEGGAADILANPKLVTQSGSTAMFKVGGEIPYITSTSNGSVNVSFKPYGVNLNIKPTVASDNIINVEVEAEVSSPDPLIYVMLSGNVVPAILTRNVKSELSVKSGSTITLAGINQTRKENSRVGIPLLCDIPVLGALFGWKKTVNKKTSVVVFLTPSVLEQ
jgi:pilus assembly protein CpaC